MQREDSEGTKTSIPMGGQREVVEGRIQRAPQPYPHRRTEDVEETTTLIPMGSQRENLEGIETSIPREEQREDPEATTSPIPTGKLIPGIRGAEALPGRYQHCAQGMWQELAGFPTRKDVAGICSRSTVWINLPHTAWDRLVLLPCWCIAHGHFQGGKNTSNFRTQDFHAFTSSSSSGSSSNQRV